jgi:hypothetical protein
MQQLGIFRIVLRISRPNHLEFFLLSENRLFIRPFTQNLQSLGSPT